MGTSLVVRSQIKDLANHEGKQLNISSDFYDELNNKVQNLIKKACIRARANGRTTIMGKDV
ncbi:MAG: DUF1931 domain-containing protein [Nanoarchaeota archaeon]